MKFYRSLFVIVALSIFSLTMFELASGAPLVAIDPGHGGKDDGAASESGLNEKDVNLDISVRVKGLLENAGFRAIQTRNNDNYVSLQERCDMANNAGADIFVSIHNNFSNNAEMLGAETYFYNSSGRGRQLAEHIQQNLVERTGSFDRGVKNSAFFVLENTKMTAALVESAFLSHSAESERLRDAGFRQSIAEGIFNGIVEYFEKVIGFTAYSPLPQVIKVHIPSVTSDTRVQVSSYFAGTKWVSQPVLAPGDYMVRIDPDGFVRSIDSKLAFTKSADAQNPGVSVYIHRPDNRNGADFSSYEWTRNASYPAGALKNVSSGYVSFDDNSMTASSSGNSAELTSAKETIFAENMMLRVHLESVTPWTSLYVPFYWKKTAYTSQKPLPAGDYWVQLGPDPNPADPGVSPYLLSLDAKINFRQARLNHNPDQVLAFYIGNPKMGEVGYDVVAFAHNLRRANTLQTMLGGLPTGPDNGLGYVSCLGVGDPNKASPSFPTIPTQILSNGNYIVVTDAGLIRGRIMDMHTGRPLAGATARIDATVMTADGNGEFSFTHLVPKAYTLEYSAGGYRPQQQVINVNFGKPTYTPWCYLSH